MLTLSLMLLTFCSTYPKPYISFRFCVSIFLLAFLSVHCVSSHQRFHKPRRISTLKIKNIIFYVYLLDHNLSYEYGSSIQGRSLQDGAKVEDFKYLSKGKIFLVPLISIISLPEDEQTSKHRGGGRYNAI
jgi:hypothetical protein